MIFNKEVNAISIGEITALSEFYLTAINKTIIRLLLSVREIGWYLLLFFKKKFLFDYSL